jgi:hypothetical protein
VVIAQKKVLGISPPTTAATASPGQRQGASITQPPDHSLQPTNPRAQAAEVAEGYAELTRRAPWDWWTTLTFVDVGHPEAADKVFRLWIHRLNRRLHGRNYWKHPETKGCFWVRATEYQKRGALHYHGMIGEPVPSAWAFDLMRDWEDLGRLRVGVSEWKTKTGYARIYPYGQDGKTGAEFYISKCMYAFKRGEIDLGGPLAQTMNQRRLPLAALKV